MKKIAILALAAVMLLSPIASTARAMEPFRQPEQTTEGGKNRRRNDRGRRDHGRDRDRHRRKSKSSGSVLGAAIGGLIVGGILGAAASESRPREPILYCDNYGNCWYEYR